MRAEAPSIVVGPLLRHVGQDNATVWVETSRPCRVSVEVARDGEPPRSTAEPTWSLHGHHYALLVLEQLCAGATYEYRLTLDQSLVWPAEQSGLPPSRIRTPDGSDRLQLAFGSCRRAEPLDEDGLATYGADALVALAEQMARTPATQWPDALLLCGDQIYADEPSERVAERLRARHCEQDPIRGEVHDFEEYAWLYADSWMQPAVRWLLSSVPTAMILDDHDLRDDWNSSRDWRREVSRQSWWHDRVVGALGSYWVYQHLGNLSPQDLAQDRLLAAVKDAPDEAAVNALVDAHAWRADQDPDSARWSFYRDFGRTRLVVVDSRVSRDLNPARRLLVDAQEWAWFTERTEADVDHLLIGTTLPYALIPGIHHLEGWNEATAEGAWGSVFARIAERIRLAIDLEHWAAFRHSFDAMARLLAARARGPRPPASILLLSGDVHCSYLAPLRLDAARSSPTRVHQLVMSPFRNPLSRSIRISSRVLASRLGRAMTHTLARSAKVSDPGVSWEITGPWFDNGVMTVRLDGREAAVDVDRALVRGGCSVLQRRGSYPLT